MRRMLGSLAHSRGLVWFPYTHGVTAAQSALQLTEAQYKQFIDDLEIYIKAGKIISIPVWQAANTIPRYTPNLILNPGFEFVDESVGGDNGIDFNFASALFNQYNAPIWTISGAGDTFTVTDTVAHSGKNCLQITRVSADGCVLKYNKIQVEPGNEYEFRFWYKMSGAGNGSMTVRLSSGASWHDHTIYKATSWTEFRAKITIPKNVSAGIPAVSLAFWPGADLTTLIDDLYFGIGPPDPIIPRVAAQDVSDPPTDAELDAIFGDPLVLDEGYTAYINDDAGGVNNYIVWVSDGKWVYQKGTVAI